MHLKSTAENTDDLVERDVIRFFGEGGEAFVLLNRLARFEVQTEMKYVKR